MWDFKICDVISNLFTGRAKSGFRLEEVRRDRVENLLERQRREEPVDDDAILPRQLAQVELVNQATL